MSQASAPKGGRDIVAYFAGHLANLVNGNDSLSDERRDRRDQAVFAVRARAPLLDHQSQIFRGAGRRLGLSAAQQRPRTPPNFYFDNVLDRPIGARGEGPTSADNLAALIGSHAIGPRAVRPPGALVDLEGAGRRRAEPAPLQRQARPVRTLQPHPEMPRRRQPPLCRSAAARALPQGMAGRRGRRRGQHAEGRQRLSQGAEGRDERRIRPPAGPAGAGVAFFAAPVPGYKDAKAFAASLLGSAILTRLAGQDQTFLLSFDVMEATQSERAGRGGRRAADERRGGGALPRGRGRGRRDRRPGNGLLAAIMAGRSLAERWAPIFTCAVGSRPISTTISRPMSTIFRAGPPSSCGRRNPARP